MTFGLASPDLLAIARAEAQRRAEGWRDVLAGAVADNHHRQQAKADRDTRIWSTILYVLGGAGAIGAKPEPLGDNGTIWIAPADAIWWPADPETADDWARLTKSLDATARAALVALEDGRGTPDHARGLCALRDHFHTRARRAADHRARIAARDTTTPDDRKAA